MDSAGVNAAFLPKPRTSVYHITSAPVLCEREPHITNYSLAVYDYGFDSSKDVKTLFFFPSLPIFITTLSLTRSS